MRGTFSDEMFSDGTFDSGTFREQDLLYVPLFIHGNESGKLHVPHLFGNNFLCDFL